MQKIRLMRPRLLLHLIQFGLAIWLLLKVPRIFTLAAYYAWMCSHPLHSHELKFSMEALGILSEHLLMLLVLSAILTYWSIRGIQRCYFADAPKLSAGDPDAGVDQQQDVDRAITWLRSHLLSVLRGGQ